MSAILNELHTNASANRKKAKWWSKPAIVRCIRFQTAGSGNPDCIYLIRKLERSSDCSSVALGSVSLNFCHYPDIFVDPISAQCIIKVPPKILPLSSTSPCSCLVMKHSSAALHAFHLPACLTEIPTSNGPQIHFQILFL
jgi:hypothetical protein